MKKFIFVALMMSFPFFWSCGAQISDGPKRIELDDAEKVYVDAGNDFAFRFLARIDENEKADWFVSPVSLQFLLGLVLDGAAGETDYNIVSVGIIGRAKDVLVHFRYDALYRA